MPDAEDIRFVVQPRDITYSDGAEGSFDRRIKAFLPEGFFDAALALYGAEHGREGQETLVGIIRQKLLFHTGVHGEVDQLSVSIEEQTVFRKPPTVHRVGEGTAAAPIIIEGFRENISGGCVQKAGINCQPILPQFNDPGNMEKVLFQKRSAKQLVAEAGRNAKMKKSA